MEDKKNDSVDAIKIGKFIKQLREKHNYTQEQFGNLVFVTRKAVSKWETGKCCPSLDVLKIISFDLAVSVEELLDGKFKNPEENNQDNSKWFKKIVNNIIFKAFLFLIAFFCILSLLIFFFENYNSTKIYTLNSISEDFVLTNGTVIYSNAKTYLNLGYFYADFGDTDTNTRYNLTLYIENNLNKNINLVSGDYYGFMFSEKYSYDELQTIHFKENMDNLYLKVEYINIYEKEVIKNFKVKVKHNFSNSEKFDTSSINNDFLITNNNTRKLETYLNSKSAMQETDLTEVDSIDVFFLYDYSLDELKEKLEYKTVKLNNKEYTIVFDEKDVIKVSAFRDKYIIDIHQKNIYYVNDNYISFPIIDDYLILNNENINIFNDLNVILSQISSMLL